MANIPLGDNAVAVLQSINQYVTGLTGGYVVDLLMDQIKVEEDNTYGQIGKQLLQAAINGIALHYMLKYIHGPTPGIAYRDPTGGYMLAIGLIQSQPIFMRNGKQLFTGLRMFIKETLDKTGNSQSSITETTAQI
jgi:hypothetical protein